MSQSDEQVANQAARAYHHGRTPAAWAGSIGAAVAFTIGSIAFVLGPNWVLVAISAVLLVLALIATVVLRRAGYGQD